MSIVSSSRTKPISQFSSRGYLYAPKKNVRPMCRKTSTTMTVEPHLCMPRTNAPSQTSLVMWRAGGGALVGGGGGCIARETPPPPRVGEGEKGGGPGGGEAVVALRGLRGG